MRPVKRLLSRLQEYLLTSQRLTDYVLVAMLGGWPIALSWMVGVHEDRALVASRPLTYVDEHGAEVATTLDAEYRSQHPIGAGEAVIARGFWSKGNWMTYPVLLPLALFLLRYFSRQILGRPGEPAFSGRLQPLQDRASRFRTDGNLLKYAIAFSLAMHAIDVWEGAERYVRWLSWQEVCIPGIDKMDWGWYGLAFSDIDPWRVALLMGFTYLEQFTLVTILCAFGFLMFSFNRGYVRAVFRRSRDANRSARETIELDFDDGNHRFGLGELYDVFNTQLQFLGMVGFAMLFSRYANVDASVTSGYLTRLVEWIKSFPTPEAFPTIPWGELFSDAGQVMLVIGWAILGFTVLIPASVKLIPFREIKVRDGREKFLRELVRKGSKASHYTTDELADRFRNNSFWPTGDRRARWLLRIAMFALLVLIFPFWPNSVQNIIAGLAPAAALSLALSKACLWWHEHRLSMLDLGPK